MNKKGQEEGFTVELILKILGLVALLGVIMIIANKMDLIKLW